MSDKVARIIATAGVYGAPHAVPKVCVKCRLCFIEDAKHFSDDG
jgi:hypothetical protein